MLRNPKRYCYSWPPKMGFHTYMEVSYNRQHTALCAVHSILVGDLRQNPIGGNTSTTKLTPKDERRQFFETKPLCCCRSVTATVNIISIYENIQLDDGEITSIDTYTNRLLRFLTLVNIKNNVIQREI